MPRRKRYCEFGDTYCKEALRVNGSPLCRLQGPLEDGDECQKIVRQRQDERARKWLAENGWQRSILFMRGIGYSTEGHEIIRDARGVLYNGKRLLTKAEAEEALSAVLPDWLIERIFTR